MALTITYKRRMICDIHLVLPAKPVKACLPDKEANLVNYLGIIRNFGAVKVYRITSRWTLSLHRTYTLHTSTMPARVK